MTLEEATNLIGRCAARMNDLYQKVVFDEWAIVTLIQHKAKILAYLGPRKDDFQKSFATDVQDLRAELLSALIGSISLIPFILSSGTGAEIEKPLAIVVVGGLVTRPIKIVILPMVYEWVERRRIRSHAVQEASDGAGTL